MRAREDNYIAQELNSLDTLPKGYEVNIASKWEMIEMGLMPKRKRSFTFYWLAAACILFVFIGFWWYENKITAVAYAKKDLPKQEQLKEAQTTVVEARPSSKQSIMPVQQPKFKQTFARTSILPNIITKKEQVDSNTSLVMQQPLLVNKLQTPLSQEVSSLDTNTTIVLTTQPIIKKNKQRYFQMDFGEGSAIDQKQKSVTGKLFQFKLSTPEIITGNNQLLNKTASPKITQPL